MLSGHTLRVDVLLPFAFSSCIQSRSIISFPSCILHSAFVHHTHWHLLYTIHAVFIPYCTVDRNLFYEYTLSLFTLSSPNNGEDAYGSLFSPPCFACLLSLAEYIPANTHILCYCYVFDMGVWPA